MCNHLLGENLSGHDELVNTAEGTLDMNSQSRRDVTTQGGPGPTSDAAAGYVKSTSQALLIGNS